MILNLETTELYEKTLAMEAAGFDIIEHRGGTRSSKTITLAQRVITILTSEPNKKIGIGRKTFTALRDTAMHDTIEILHANGLYRKEWHSRRDNVFVYPYTGSKIHFVGLDNPQKKRGAEWNYFWFNEATETVPDDFRQIYMRMSRKSEDGKPNIVYIDFNPDDSSHYIKTDLEDQGRTGLIISNYKDNGFLDTETVRRIEEMEKYDPDFWKIFGMGEWGEIKGQIFTNWKTIPSFPDETYMDWIVYGMDFGYSLHPSTLVKIGYDRRRNTLAMECLLYRTGMVNRELANIMRSHGLDNNSEVYADLDGMLSIAEINEHGFNVIGAVKGPGSVEFGIQLLKEYNLEIVGPGNFTQEAQRYKWIYDSKKEVYLRKPVKAFDHCWDAARYAVVMKIAGGMITRKGKAGVW